MQMVKTHFRFIMVSWTVTGRRILARRILRAFFRVLRIKNGWKINKSSWFGKRMNEPVWNTVYLYDRFLSAARAAFDGGEILDGGTAIRTIWILTALLSFLVRRNFTISVFEFWKSEHTFSDYIMNYVFDRRMNQTWRSDQVSFK